MVVIWIAIAIIFATFIVFVCKTEKENKILHERIEKRMQESMMLEQLIERNNECIEILLDRMERAIEDMERQRMDKVESGDRK